MDSIEEIKKRTMASTKKVRTFANDNDIEGILHNFYRQNLNGLIKIGQRYDLVMDHYKEASGWAQRFHEAQERALLREKIVERVNPLSVRLPAEEMEKFRAAYPAPAEGLELTSTINLGYYSKKYHFQAGIIRPDFPEFQSSDFRTIPKLVMNVTKYLEKQQKKFHGAEINPFFYTIEEENRLEREEKESMIDFLKKTMPISLLLERKIKKEMDKPIRGLSAEEREEFEKHYFWNV